MNAVAINFSLTVGEWCEYLLAVGIPKTGGVFLGYTKPLGFLVFQGVDVNGNDTGEVTFVNPAHILWVRPETF